MIRYVIELAFGVQVAVLYNVKREELTVGGKAKNIVLLNGLLGDYFGVRVMPEPQWIQKNKVRYKMGGVKLKAVTTAVQALRDGNITVEEVKNLGTIMR